MHATYTCSTCLDHLTPVLPLDFSPSALHHADFSFADYGGFLSELHERIVANGTFRMPDGSPRVPPPSLPRVCARVGQADGASSQQEGPDRLPLPLSSGGTQHSCSAEPEAVALSGASSSLSSSNGCADRGGEACGNGGSSGGGSSGGGGGPDGGEAGSGLPLAATYSGVAGAYGSWQGARTDGANGLLRGESSALAGSLGDGATVADGSALFWAEASGVSGSHSPSQGAFPRLKASSTRPSLNHPMPALDRPRKPLFEPHPERCQCVRCLNEEKTRVRLVSRGHARERREPFVRKPSEALAPVHPERCRCVRCLNEERRVWPEPFLRKPSKARVPLAECEGAASRCRCVRCLNEETTRVRLVSRGHARERREPFLRSPSKARVPLAECEGGCDCARCMAAQAALPSNLRSLHQITHSIKFRPDGATPTSQSASCVSTPACSTTPSPTRGWTTSGEAVGRVPWASDQANSKQVVHSQAPWSRDSEPPPVAPSVDEPPAQHPLGLRPIGEAVTDEATDTPPPPSPPQASVSTLATGENNSPLPTAIGIATPSGRSGGLRGVAVAASGHRRGAEGGGWSGNSRQSGATRRRRRRGNEDRLAGIAERRVSLWSRVS